MSLGTPNVEEIHIVVFGLRDGEKQDRTYYGLSVDEVREIRPVEHITRIPTAPSHVLGAVNYRGKVIVLIDVKAKLGISTTQGNGSKPRIIVVEVGDVLTGLLVDEVDQVLRIPIKDLQITQAEYPPSRNFLKGTVRSQSRQVHLLDVERLLDADVTDVRMGRK